MTYRSEATIDTTALQGLTARLAAGSRRYAPRVGMHDDGLPGREPGQALSEARTRSTVGPRALILDCGTSRLPGYTHVLWISPAAEAMVGSRLMDDLGVVMGRVVGVEAFAWEGLERLHLRAPGLAWDELLREAQDALGAYLETV